MIETSKDYSQFFKTGKIEDYLNIKDSKAVKRRLESAYLNIDDGA